MIGSGYNDGRLSAGNDPGVERRIGVIAVGMLLIFFVFVLRLFHLQIVEGADLRSRSERNFVRTVQLEAARGDIVDRNGVVLATTRPAYRVQIMPNELGDGSRTFRVLGGILGVPPDELSRKVGKPSGRQRFQPIVLERDLPYERFTQVESHRYALPGVVTDISPRRYYVEHERAAHLIGTIGEIASRQLEKPEFSDYAAGEIVGQFGLEAQVESHLRGSKGGRNVVVDVAGREIETLDEVAPVPGGRVVLTLDADLQRIAEDGFRSEQPTDPELPPVPDKMGAAVAVDPRSGEILAIVSRPAYDPNGFAGGIDAKTWEQLTENPWKPLRNRAISGQYSPGSTYKSIVAVAGLAEGEISPDDVVYCPGYYRLGRRVYRCWKRGGHGEVNLEQALKGSCDVFFYELGVKLGIDRIARYAAYFGLGRATGVPVLGEKRGLIPTREWKERAKGEEWIKGETVSASIGQGYNLTTPIQLAMAYAALGNGGTLYKPKLVKRLETWDGRVIETADEPVGEKLPIPPEVLEEVRRGLTQVVEGEHGTGARARIEGIEVAGKTGTTQVVSLDLVKGLEPEEIPIRYRDHALFAAFAPAQDPEIAVAVLVEHAGGGGGRVAAPIAQRIMARYFEKKNLLPETIARKAEGGVDRPRPASRPQGAERASAPTPERDSASRPSRVGFDLAQEAD